jgi:hypothetical protein
MKALATVALLVYVLVSYRGIEGGTFETLSDCLQHRQGLNAGGYCLPVWPSAAAPHPQRSLADSGYATSPPSPALGYDAGYGTVVPPSQPFSVVQIPL